MPGQIPEPSVTAGSLPSLGPLAGISATTLTDKLKYGDLQDFGPMLSPLHFLDSLGKRSLMIKAEVRVRICIMTAASAVPGFLYLFQAWYFWDKFYMQIYHFNHFRLNRIEYSQR